MRTPTHTLEVYRGKNKEFRWRMRHRNGKIVAEGGEGYNRKPTMMRTLWKLGIAIADGNYKTKDLT